MVAYKKVFEKVVVVTYTCTRSSCYKRVEHLDFGVFGAIHYFISSYKKAIK